MKLAERIFKRSDYTKPIGGALYGMRKHPVTGELKMHNGVDYSTHKEKWNQYALEDGIVLAAGIDKDGYNALFAWVSYTRLGIKCLHYHLDEVFVKKGQKVTQDTIIGTTGTSGLSTGIHLHLGVKHLSDDKYFDPETFDYKPLDDIKVVENLAKVSDAAIKVTDKVKIIGTNYATGQVVPAKIKLNTYTVAKILNGKALLSEIKSYVFIKDLKKV